MLNLRIMAPNRIVWNSDIQEIVLSTNSGQIGILPNHASILTALDIGIVKIRINDQWSTMALMGGFAMIDNNNLTILVNDAEKASEIDFEEAQEIFQEAKTKLNGAMGNKKKEIENLLIFKRAKARLEAVDAMTPK
uniref:ATP synthase epsilon chain, chloroplastic n=1 Tax=Cyathodium smaragdinum TaxID=2846787 RepID=A0A8F2XVP4_9MARC|nr:ATP synthase CF1 epsilon subunit [Cyathodium smaragdinum]